MIGDHFVNYLHETPPRHMKNLNSLLTFIDRKVHTEKNRVLGSSSDGYGNRLLMNIVKSSNISDLDLTKTDLSSFAKYVFENLNEIEKPIDVRIGKITTERLFIKSDKYCFELMTPSRQPNPLDDLSDFENPITWENIKPLRISDMGTSILKLNFQTDYLSFKKHSPTHAIYSLDCFNLIMKCFAHFKYLNIPKPSDHEIRDFIHDKVIVPAILTDNVSIWLRNIYRLQLKSDSPLYIKTSTMWDEISTDTLGSSFNYAMQEIVELKTSLMNMNVKPQYVLASLRINQSESIVDFYKYLYSTTRVPEQKAYIWVDVVKNIPWWELIILINSFVPNNPEVSTFNNRIERELYFWLSMKPWNEVRMSIPLKTIVETKLTGMYEYLKSL